MHFSRDTIVELLNHDTRLSILTRSVATSGGNENGSGVLPFLSSTFKAKAFEAIKQHMEKFLLYACSLRLFTPSISFLMC